MFQGSCDSFESVVLSDLVLDDQIRLFSNAEYVVAAHGAGLTNLLFAERSTVFELYRRDERKDYFSVISTAMGGDHHMLESDAHGMLDPTFVVDQVARNMRSRNEE